MKPLLIIFFACFCIGFCNAQTDTIKASKQIKEAPEDLKKLIKEITEEKAQKISKDADLEIDGLLFDETKTKSGRFL